MSFLLNPFILQQAGAGNPFDLTAPPVFNQSFDISGQEGSISGVFFKPDGTEMYITGTVSDSVHQYTLSTAWDISSASLTDSFDVSGQLGAPQTIYMRADGLKFFLLGTTNDTVYRYDMSSAWDLTTASFDTGQSVSIASEDNAPSGLFFRDNGLKMYMYGAQTDSVHQYTLSSAWDLTTVSYDSVSLNVLSQGGGNGDIFIRGDGSQLFHVNNTNDSAYRYTMSSAWDLSTASFDTGQSFDLSSQDGGITDIFLRSDGLKMYISGLVNDNVYEYDL